MSSFPPSLLTSSPHPSVQVASLRLRFTHSLEEGGLAGDRRGVVPAAGLALSLEEMWRVICDNKDLDLPAHKVREGEKELWRVICDTFTSKLCQLCAAMKCYLVTALLYVCCH